MPTNFSPARRVHREIVTTDGRRAVLRQVTKDDLDACLAFATSLAEEYAADVYHGTLVAKAPTRTEEIEWLSKTLLDLEKGMMVSVAAEMEGAFAGHSHVSRGSHPDLTHHGSLGIAVSRPYRGIGLGTAMLRTLIEESAALGLRTIELGALATNENAIRLYERMGFKKVGVIPQKFRRRGIAIDEMIMSLEL